MRRYTQFVATQPIHTGHEPTQAKPRRVPPPIPGSAAPASAGTVVAEAPPHNHGGDPTVPYDPHARRLSYLMSASQKRDATLKGRLAHRYPFQGAPEAPTAMYPLTQQRTARSSRRRSPDEVARVQRVLYVDEGNSAQRERERETTREKRERGRGETTRANAQEPSLYTACSPCGIVVVDAV